MRVPKRTLRTWRKRLANTVEDIDALLNAEEDPQPEPEPSPSDPFEGLDLIARLSKKADWHHELVEDGSIVDDVEGIRYSCPTKNTRIRTEMQFARESQPIPGENGYRFKLRLEDGCVIGDDQKGLTRGATIMQTHTDVDDAHGGGYSGGMAVKSDKLLVQRITGNKDAGEDQVFTIGGLEWGRFHLIETRIVWRDHDAGSVRTWLDGKLLLDVPSIVTCPDGATQQKFRNGWYAEPSHGLDMTIAEAEVWG